MTTKNLGGSKEDLARWNRRAVLREILYNGPVSRSEIAKVTQLNPSTITRITRELIEHKLLINADVSPQPKQKGRRFVHLNLNPEGGYIIAIGLNALEQRVTLADLGNNTIEAENLDLPSLSNPNKVLDALAKSTNKLIKRAGINRRRVLGGCLSIAGVVNPITGNVQAAKTLGWEDVAVGKYLSDKLSLPFRIENIPNTINLAEARFGLAKTRNNVVLANTAMGIGISLMLGKRLIRGTDFSAGVVGDICFPTNTVHHIAEPTLNNLAGGRAILSQMKNLPDIPSETWKAPPRQQMQLLTELASQGNEHANQICRVAGNELGKVLQTMAALIRPEALILSGSLAQISSYRESVHKLIDSLPATGSGTIRFLVSDMTSQSASRWLALIEFLGERDLDLSALSTDKT